MTNEPRSHRPTTRQQQVLDFITVYQQTRGFPPTVREIGEHMRIRSCNGVNDHLKALEHKGYLKRDKRTSRGLHVVGPENYAERVRQLGGALGVDLGVSGPLPADWLDRCVETARELARLRA